MFDSENIPLVTRIEASTGIIVTYQRNNDNEGVWTASIDSDYIVSLITVNSRFNDSETAELNLLRTTATDRLTYIESLLGVGSPEATIPSVAPEDSDIFRVIKYVQPVTNLTGQLKVRWSIVSFDNSSIVSKDVTFGVGSTRENVLNALMYSLKSSVLASNYLNTIRFDDGTAQIHFSWKPGYDTLQIKLTVLQQSDSVVFTVNQ